jgi:hypothetical protein
MLLLLKVLVASPSLCWQFILLPFAWTKHASPLCAKIGVPENDEVGCGWLVEDVEIFRETGLERTAPAASEEAMMR